MRKVRIDQLGRCFEGIIPCVTATCSADGTPNVTYVSQVQIIDHKHVALSNQFFNKTRRNLGENPYACLQFYDPLTFEAYRAVVRFDHSETSGPVFETMSARIDAIASQTGMTGIFKLLAADVCEVISLEYVEGFLLPPEEDATLYEGRVSIASMNEIRALQLISDRLNRARDLDQAFTSALASFDELLGLRHTMVLVPDETGERLVTLASHGYGESGVGAEVGLGEGIIGIAASTRRLVRVTGLGWELRYARAVRARVQSEGGALRPEIPLPGLPKAESQLALPMLLGDELVGVLMCESADGLAFRAWHESFLQVLANQIAQSVDRLRNQEEEAAATVALPVATPPAPPSPVARPEACTRTALKFQFFKNDDCVFVDGEYLVRNVPGKILWKILTEHQHAQRTQFTNRELRLDPTLGLPALKDNLESRLILLRKRLAEKCPDVRLVPTQRGRFALELERPVELVEREHG